MTLCENKNPELFPSYYKALPSVVHPNIISLEEGSGHITLDTKFTIQDWLDGYIAHQKKRISWMGAICLLCGDTSHFNVSW